jgi:hypothetical protein
LSATEFGKALVYPATKLAVLFAYLLFFVVFQVALSGNLIAILAALFLAPGFFRYLMIILEARALGRDPEPPDIDLFLWFGHGWALFPVVWFVVLVYVTWLTGNIVAAGLSLLIAIAVLAVFPASMAVLSMSHSPAQSLRPRAILGVIRRAGAAYWVVVGFAIVSILIAWWMSVTSLHPILQNAITFYLVFAFFALIGTIVHPLHLEEEMDIPEPLAQGVEEAVAELAKDRTAVLNHAYGFISRDNRSGGFGHIENYIATDANPDSAWAWFFEQMLRWEKKEPALFFAQRYLSHLLHGGDAITAVKVIMRCRMENEAFMPLPEDRELAIEAAELLGNEELARSL